MNWEKLYNMQQELDSYIANNHELEGKDLYNERHLAFLVELGELANETRCFKFWSKKKPSERDVILAEYVDGIHFLLSIGLEKGYRYNGEKAAGTENQQTKQFNHVFIVAAGFNQNPSEEGYIHLFKEFIHLGKVLGFNEVDIYNAYLEKNEINYERQDQGY
ncbi:dUTP diphosphatase [Oceanobacillus alkalisoli]|uniref:dUTP diphosphatase n=1 Tax=Oceanobacillus alkalisoli TaxID=2925113 RepID=UPI001EE4C664|nr:dUTP diphosphatase [Oceanobacillus alkalisoli]MCG5104319.1 dUTP diphosphatase [Oceanobacillus alkalisoli]